MNQISDHAHQALVFAVITMVALAGCSGEAKKNTSTNSSAAETTSTAAIEADAANQQLDFFTEKYLAPEKRLQRRQERIESVLSVP